MPTEQDNHTPSPPAAQTPQLPDICQERRRVWESTALLDGENEAVIVHRGQLYRLRCTRQGKLILYK